MSRKRANLLKKFMRGSDSLNMVVSLLNAKPRERVLSSVKMDVSLASSAALFASEIRSMM